MRALNKGQTKQWEAIEERLNAAKDGVNDAREAMTEAIKAAIAAHQEAYSDAISEWTAAGEAATEFASEVKDAIEAYTSERSDEWQEGASATAYETWKSEWENFDPAQGDNDLLELIVGEINDDSEAAKLEPCPDMDEVCEAWSGLSTSVGS